MQNRQRGAATALPAPRPRSLPEVSSHLAARLAPSPIARQYDLTATRSGYSSLRHPDRVPTVRSTNRHRAPRCGRRDESAARHHPKHRAVCPMHPDIHQEPSGPIHCRDRYGAAAAHVPSRSPTPPVPPRADRCVCRSGNGSSNQRDDRSDDAGRRGFDPEIPRIITAGNPRTLRVSAANDYPLSAGSSAG